MVPPGMLTRHELLQLWERRMIAAHIDSPRLSSQILLAHLLSIDRLTMLLERFVPVPEDIIVQFEALAARRCAGEPVAYLIGKKEFYGRSFVVTPDVLIPRPETEGMIDLLQALVPAEQQLLCADIGTGSGILAVTAALSFPGAHVLATDISFAALRVARTNALAHKVESRISFLHSSLAAGIDIRQCDIVLANLPYIPAVDAKAMDHEVLRFEPHGALFGGTDGLVLYRDLAAAVQGLMKPGAILIAEIDYRQGMLMSRLWAPLGKKCEVHKDLAGHDRIVVVVF